MSKGNKEELKKVKQLIKDKKYDIAIKMCKKVLKEDKRNYNALVLMGAAMKDVVEFKGQVPNTLKKATDIQPDHSLAWYGLLVYYEQEPDNVEKWTELIPIYNKLLELESDSTKFVQYLKDLTKTLLQLNNDKSLSESITILCKLREREDSNEEKIKKINDTLTSILMNYPNLSNDHDTILLEILAGIIENENSDNRYEDYKRYLKLLYRTENFNKLLSEAEKMYKLFKDIYPLEWICRVYSECPETCEEINIVIFYETLLDHDPESILGYFAKAVHLYKTGNLIDARNILSHLVSVKPKWFNVWFLLSKIDIMLYCWEDAETAALHAQKLMPEKNCQNYQCIINLILLEALIKSSNKLKWKKAEAMFNKLSDDSAKCSVLRAHLHVLLRNPCRKDLLNELKEDPKTKIDATILHAMDLLEERHLEEAIDVLGSVLETSVAWLTLGKIHWEMANYGHSLMAFLKAIRTDPNNWECLVYLGKYHQECTKDYERSKKCYQKALQINPNSDQAGIGLSIVHQLLGNTEENLQFLNELISQGRAPKWALVQLGLQHLDDGNIIEAVSVLQNAVKADPSNSNCWECLADAYLARGAYTSALKSYERATELNPGSFYSLTQLSYIKLLIGQYALARNDFLNILEENENKVIILKGLAESCFKLGKENASKQLLARARDDFQEAANYVINALKQRSDFLCNWKLLGDICYNVAFLPKKYCFLNVIPELVQSDLQDESVKITRKELFMLTVKCYCRALSMSKKSSLLWHDLACCYLAQLYLDNSIDCNEVANKSLAAAKEAIKIDPLSWIHWNLLGVICMTNEIKNYALAQHSFVVAIERDSNNPIPWTNLGTLYLLLEEPYRANEAFSWALKIDPEYINCWIGQAFIAEKLSEKDALDLFCHTTRLGYHHEAASGYTHWVIKTMMDPEAKNDLLHAYLIEKMHALTVAGDVIQWYTVHFPCDPYALNARGLLLERQRLYKSAAECFSNALKYAKGDKQKNLLNINLARVKVQQGHFEDAVKICLTIKETSFASHCQLALSLFKAEQFKESYEAYEATLHWLADAETDKAYVLCAMAAMAYMFQESNDAKTLLYQSVGIKPPIISGLLALAALGMLDGDQNLTHLVLKELEPHDNNPKYRNHIAKLMAYSYLIQNDMESASRILCKYVHRYPDSSEMWTNLARILLTMNDISFSKCVDKALFLGRNSSNEHIAKITCMSSLSKLIKSSSKEGLRSVLNTVHSFPANADSWANLITALLPRWSKISQFNAHWLMVLASRVRNNLVCTRNMEMWLLKNEKQANDIAYC